MKSQYLGYRSNSDNLKFIKIAESPIAEGRLFFHVENAILKQMNDKILEDKELSASLQSLFSKIFFEELQKDLTLRPEAIYSDYKSIRLSLAKDSKLARESISEVYRKTALRFRNEVKALPHIQTLFQVSGGRIEKNSAAWNLAGLGGTPDEAALVSRASRLSPLIEVGVPIVHHLSEGKLSAEISANWKQQENWRRHSKVLAEKEFGTRNPIFNGEILSAAAIEIFRKGDANDREHYFTSIAERFKTRFGKNPSAELVQALEKYLHHADVFAPSIYEAVDQKNLGVGAATEGVVTFDLIGQNVRNTSALLGALQSSRGQHELLQKTRAAQQLESQRFNDRRNSIESVIRLSKLPGKVVLSGDEVIFAPSRPLTSAERAALFEKLHEYTGGGSVRMTYIPPNHTASGEPLSARGRSEAISKAENIEKKIRLKLEELGYTQEQLSRLTICVEYQPSPTGAPTITIRSLPRIATVSERD